MSFTNLADRTSFLENLIFKKLMDGQKLTNKHGQSLIRKKLSKGIKEHIGPFDTKFQCQISQTTARPGTKRFKSYGFG